MNEHANLKKIFWILLACIVVIFITIYITGKGNTIVLDDAYQQDVNEAQTEQTAVIPSKQEQLSDEDWANKQKEAAIAEAKLNPIYVINGEVLSVSESAIDLKVADNVRFPISGKQTIAVLTGVATTSIAVATCTTSTGNMPIKSCTTEEITLNSVKTGTTVSVSLDEELFKKDGTLVAKSILVQ